MRNVRCRCIVPTDDRLVAGLRFLRTRAGDYRTMSNASSPNLTEAAAAKIEQFRRVTQQSPADPLGYFSLGRAQLDAGANDDAVGSLQRALALDSKLSRAYQ